MEQTHTPSATRKSVKEITVSFLTHGLSDSGIQTAKKLYLILCFISLTTSIYYCFDEINSYTNVDFFESDFTRNAKYYSVISIFFIIFTKFFINIPEESIITSLFNKIVVTIIGLLLATFIFFTVISFIKSGAGFLFSKFELDFVNKLDLEDAQRRGKILIYTNSISKKPTLVVTIKDINQCRKCYATYILTRNIENFSMFKFDNNSAECAGKLQLDDERTIYIGKIILPKACLPKQN